MSADGPESTVKGGTGHSPKLQVRLVALTSTLVVGAVVAIVVSWSLFDSGMAAFRPGPARLLWGVLLLLPILAGSVMLALLARGRAGFTHGRLTPIEMMLLVIVVEIV